MSAAVPSPIDRAANDRAPSAFPAQPPTGSAAFRTLSEQLADPSVITEYRPGACAYEYSETFGGPLGPRPIDAVRSILRNLSRTPDAVLCDPDPASPNRAYLTANDQPLARISGLTPDQVNDALLSLAVSGWAPGAREAGSNHAATAADRMPGRVAAGGPERPTTAAHKPAARQSRFL